METVQYQLPSQLVENSKANVHDDSSDKSGLDWIADLTDELHADTICDSLLVSF